MTTLLASVLLAPTMAMSPGPEIRFEALEAKKPDAYEAKMVFPQFDGNAVAFAASRQLQTYARTRLVEFTLGARQVQADWPDFPAPFALDGEATVSLATDRMISVLFFEYEYSGGAHPNTFYVPFNYAMKGGNVKEIKFDDLWRDGVDGRKLVWPLLRDELMERKAAWIVAGEYTDLHDDLAGKFIVSKTHMTFAFSPYDVGPYAQGEFIVKFPLSRFADGLNPALGLVPAR